MTRLTRALHDTIENGKYKPAFTRKVQIPKSSGGMRTLSIPTVADRVAQRAVLMAIQPFVDPQFHSLTMGGRPGYSVTDALVLAEKEAVETGNWCWAVADIKTAFDVVPHIGLLGTLRTWFGTTQVYDLLKKVVSTGREYGIPQGGPLSPLLLNLYLDDVLDKPWAQSHPKWPQFRWLDDSCIIAYTLKEAHCAIKSLAATLRPAGFALKPNATLAADLNVGNTVEWLGMRVRKVGKGLVATVTDKAWHSLRDNIAMVNRENTEADNNNRPATEPEELHHRGISESVRGWIISIGAVTPVGNDIKRIARITEEIAPEVVTVNDIRTWWCTAHAAYQEKRAAYGLTNSTVPVDIRDTGEPPTAPPVGI